MLISLLHLLNKGQLSKFTGRQFQSTLLAWDHFCASEANAYFDLCSLVVLNLNRRFYLRTQPASSQFRAERDQPLGTHNGLQSQLIFPL